MQLVTEWAARVHACVHIVPNSKIEAKYHDGYIYFALPVKDTDEEIRESGLTFSSDIEIIKEDNKTYIAVRHNDLIAEMYEYYLEDSRFPSET